MGIVAKLFWVALPALAGCAVLSQVSSQGAGTNPGGKATSDHKPAQGIAKAWPDFIASASIRCVKLLRW
ncbi:MAG: hypothetical protein BGO01_07705 [Armatimonadetes bacterium 55-13]|nr:hypothetical protein [Armatimonadota bacterium]OJU63744.1 MAG: hypothetical protein BGO01_07705 [Armatimonadetes bacterium 55-13]